MAAECAEHDVIVIMLASAGAKTCSASEVDALLLCPDGEARQALGMARVQLAAHRSCAVGPILV